MVLSVLWMLIISPLTLKSTRSMLAMQKLQPQLKRLQEQHKDDKQAFAQAQMDSVPGARRSPFGSCLPMLLPMPVFFALFRVIQGLSHTVNGSRSRSTCRTPPGCTRTSSRLRADQRLRDEPVRERVQPPLERRRPHCPYWILVLVLAGTGYLQSAQMMSRNPNPAQNPQMRLMKYLPLVFMVLFIRFPAGVLLYYAMSNICRIVQQDLMYRFDPKVKGLVAQEIEEVETHTHEIDEKEGNGQARRGGGGRSPPGTGGRGALPVVVGAPGRQGAPAAGGGAASATFCPRPPSNSRRHLPGQGARIRVRGGTGTGKAHSPRPGNGTQGTNGTIGRRPPTPTEPLFKPGRRTATNSRGPWTASLHPEARATGT